MNGCEGSPIYLPINECGECDAFEQRIVDLEDMVSDKQNVTISATDSDGNKVTLTVLASVS